MDEKHAIVVTDHDLLMRSTVFAGINQNLLQDERHPLLVGQKLFMRHRHVKRQVLVDEKRHVFAQNLLHELKQINRNEFDVMVKIGQALIIKQQIQLIFGIINLLLHARAVHDIRRIGHQLQCRQRRLHLMTPDDQIIVTLFELLLKFLRALIKIVPFFTQLAQEFSFNERPAKRFVNIAIFNASENSKRPHGFKKCSTDRYEPGKTHEVADQTEFQIIKHAKKRKDSHAKQIYDQCRPAVRQIFPDHNFSSKR